MKIVFVSGFLNNHLLPLCDELTKKCDFSFVATQDWQTKGYNRSAIHCDYVLNYYESGSKQRIERIVREADVGIFGGSSDSLLEIRKLTGKLSFIYTERLFKRGKWQILIPNTRAVYHMRFKKNNSNVYVLCASSYVSEDLRLLSFPEERCFKFGYFPKTEYHNLANLIQRKSHNKLKLLYVGRLLKLKRVKDILNCCRYLKASGFDFELKIIGDGPERTKIEKTMYKLGLVSCVEILGEKSPHEVAQYMCDSSILYFSSNKREGWGAVVNEALSYACLVIASNACGSTKYIIESGYNGAVYPVGQPYEMYKRTVELWKSENLEHMYQNAYKSISDLWNAEVAAKRLVEISTRIIEGKSTTVFNFGPLSKG